MKIKLKKIIFALFYILSIFYFYQVIKGIDFESFNGINSFKTYFVSFILILFHSLLLSFIAYVYSFNLVAFSNGKKGVTEYTRVATKYLSANVAKYVPGNVVHYVGRNALLNEIGYGHKQIAFSSIFEIIVFALACLLIATITSFNIFLEQVSLYLDFRNLITLLTIILILGLLTLTAVIVYIRKKKSELINEYREMNICL